MNIDQAFVRQMRRLLPEESERFLESLDEDIPISIRLNTTKCPDEGFFKTCFPANIVGKVPWCNGGYYLDKRPSFTFDPLLHSGVYYVQEASSMFTAQAIKEALKYISESGRSLRMLDLCAAPGGKSTLAASFLPQGSLLVANEIIPSRAKILDENLIKWGTASVVVTQNDPLAFSALDAVFDLILTDMPCSGEGMFRKEPEAIEAWSEDYIRTCAVRQRNILTQCWNSLRPGGCLIYSTCTYNTSENEDNVQWAAEHLGACILPIDCSPDWNIHSAIGHDFPAYRFFPHRTKGEGFFMALLQKKGSVIASSSSNRNSVKIERRSRNKNRNNFGILSWEKNPKSLIGKPGPEIIDKNLRSYLYSLFDDPDLYEMAIVSPGLYGAFPKEHLELLSRVRSSLRVLRAGLILGEYKAGQFVPDISLALSTATETKKQLPSYSLNLHQALSYLKRESLNLSNDCPTGQVLMNYCGFGLGWVKNIGLRANNRYPQSWRIRSELPANITVL